MHVSIAVPTYARAETFASKTLPELLRLGVDPSAIHVFLSDPTELKAYLAAARDLAPQTGSHRINWVPGALGVGPNRNLIHHHWPEGTRVLSIDDDVRSILIRRDERTLVPIEPYEFNEILAEAFTLTSGLWGVHPVSNAYFQRFKISRDLRYIAAGLYGFTTRADPALDVDLEDKEDFLRSILWYLADGHITRLNWVSLKTAGYHGAGGMQVTRTPERVRASAEEIARRYPDLASLNLTKKSGWAEVRLRDRRPQAEALA